MASPDSIVGKTNPILFVDRRSDYPIVRACMWERKRKGKGEKEKKRNFIITMRASTNNSWGSSSAYPALWDRCERYTTRKRVSLFSSSCIKSDLTIASSDRSFDQSHLLFMLRCTDLLIISLYIRIHVRIRICLCFTAVCKFPSWSSSNVPRCFFLVPRPASFVPWRM